MAWKHQCSTTLFGIVTLFFCTLTSSTHAQQIDTAVFEHYDNKIRITSASLDSIKMELQRGRQKIQELSTKEGTYLAKLEQLEKNIEASQHYLTKITNRIDTVSTIISQLKDSLAQVSEALKVRQKKMKQRLRNIYKVGQPHLTEILLTSTTIADFLHRIKYFQKLNNFDKMLLHTIDSTRIMVKTHAATLELEQEELTALKNKKELERKELENEQYKRKIMLGQVQSEKDAFTLMVKELERAQEELNIIIQKLESKRKEAKQEYDRNLQISFEKRRGTLPWPVKGTVIREYGKIVHPVYKTVIMNNGIDIRSTAQENVVCIAPGIVDYIGWMRGYGKFLIVNHYGNYITIYAHLDRIQVTQGQHVLYGTVLGIVGETGSLDGTKLHFQIRKSQEPLNPREWLEKKE